MADRSLVLAERAAATPACRAVQLATMPPMARFAVHATDAAMPALGEAVGLELPTSPCRSTSTDDRAALWLGPYEWLVLLDEGVVLSPLPPGCSVVDVSHGLVAITVQGERAAWSINTYCALDLHSLSFPVDMCTRTLFAKAQIVLWRRETDLFHIEVARSLAPYVWDLLLEARREFAC